jgi:hypothetical protein
MPTASFSVLPSPISIAGAIANTLVIGYLVHVIHKVTKKVLFADFTRWNELKRYHVMITVLGMCVLITDILVKAGCNVIQDREEQYPLECNILVLTVNSLIVGGYLIGLESTIFSYCRLYMILPGIFYVY